MFGIYSSGDGEYIKSKANNREKRKSVANEPAGC